MTDGFYSKTLLHGVILSLSFYHFITGNLTNGGLKYGI